MTLRLARPADAAEIADIYLACADDLGLNILCELGRSFIRAYHAVYLREPNSLILCAENDDGSIVGFVSGTLAAEEHSQALRTSRLKLGLAAIPAFLRRPGLAVEMLKRYRTASIGGSDYIVGRGCRWEFWGVLKEARGTSAGKDLHDSLIALFYLMGGREVWFEVDKDLKKVVALHQRWGGQIVDEVRTPDGRERYFMKYDEATMAGYYRSKLDNPGRQKSD